MEARPSNIEGRGEVTIRSSSATPAHAPGPDHAGEVRDEAALDMLQAMNRSRRIHTTIHANSARFLSRLETMVLGRSRTPGACDPGAGRGAIDLIIQQARPKDGSRRTVQSPKW